MGRGSYASSSFYRYAQGVGSPPAFDFNFWCTNRRPCTLLGLGLSAFQYKLFYLLSAAPKFWTVQGVLDCVGLGRVASSQNSILNNLSSCPVTCTILSVCKCKRKRCPMKPNFAGVTEPKEFDSTCFWLGSSRRA